MPIRTLRLASLGLALAAVLPLGLRDATAQIGPGPAGKAPFSAQAPARNEAGKFDYYSLVMSWSPTHCAGLQRNGYDPQCHSRDGKRYSFILHGLWPQHERGWPQDCPTQSRPFVQQKTIDGMLDIMPSRGLIIHEYRKHGTCSGLSPEDYFAVSRQLFKKVAVPPRYERPNQALTVSPTEIVRDFLTANPGLKAENLAVACGGPGNRLREIRVCFSREGQYRACGRNEDARKLCSAPKVYLPPVRDAAGGGTSGQNTSPQKPGGLRDERRI